MSKARARQAAVKCLRAADRTMDRAIPAKLKERKSNYNQAHIDARKQKPELAREFARKSK